MATRLYVRLTRSATEPGRNCEWVLRDARGALIRSGSDPLKALPVAGQTIGVLATDVLLMRTIALPPGARARTQAAMAHALEPFMLSDPAANHVVALETTKDGSTVLAAVARHWIDTCLALLARAGRYPSRVIVESSLVERKPGTWFVVHDSSGGFVVSDDRRTTALDSVTGRGVPAGLLWLVKSAVDAKQTPQCVRVYTANSASIDAAAWGNEIGVPVENAGNWDWRPRTDPATGFSLETQANVLAGLPGNGTGSVQNVKAWRITALLGALTVAVHAGSVFIHWIVQSAERSSLEADMRAIYRKSVSASDPLVDPPLQMHRALSGARRAAGTYSSEDFVVLLGRLSAESMGASMGRLQFLQYSSGTLTAEFRGAQAAAIQRITEKLRGLGLRVDVTATSAQTVERLVITAEP